MFFFISKSEREQYLTLAELEARSLNINMMNSDDLENLFNERLGLEDDDSEIIVIQDDDKAELEDSFEPLLTEEDDSETIAFQEEDRAELEDRFEPLIPEDSWEDEEESLKELVKLDLESQLDEMLSRVEDSEIDLTEEPIEEVIEPDVLEPMTPTLSEELETPLEEELLPELVVETPVFEKLDPEETFQLEEKPVPEERTLPEDVIETPVVKIEEPEEKFPLEEKPAPEEKIPREEVVVTPVITAVEPEKKPELPPEPKVVEEKPEIKAPVDVEKKSKIVDVEAEKKKKQVTKTKADQLLKSLNFDLSKKLKQTTQKKRETASRKTDWKGIESARSVVSSNKALISKTLLKGDWKHPEMSPAQLRKYMPVVNAALKPHWHVPVELDPTLRVLVTVFVAKDGRIIRYDTIETSGSKIFDQAVDSVFLSLKELPPLPDSFPGEYTEIGLRFTSSL